MMKKSDRPMVQVDSGPYHATFANNWKRAGAALSVDFSRNLRKVAGIVGSTLASLFILGMASLLILMIVQPWATWNGYIWPIYTSVGSNIDYLTEHGEPMDRERVRANVVQLRKALVYEQPPVPGCAQQGVSQILAALNALERAAVLPIEAVDGLQLDIARAHFRAARDLSFCP